MKGFWLFLSLFIISSQAFAKDCLIPVEKENLCLEIKWQEGPKYDVYSKATFTFSKKDSATNTPVAPSKEIDIYPWMIMTGMEHGARPVVLKNISPGVYEVAKIYFSEMDGTWEMRVRYADGDRRTGALTKVKVEFR